MNSRLLFFTFFIVLSSCGLKGDPVAPKSTHLPSLVEENYPDIELHSPINENN